MGPIDACRYFFVRLWCCPLPGLPAKTPFFGGKTLVEILVCLAFFGISAALVATIEGGDLGSIANFVGAAMIAFAMRKVSVLSILGISFERALLFHKSLAICVLLLLLAHGIQEGASASGLIIGILCGVAVLSYSLSYFNISFNAFYGLHVLCYIILAPVLIIHGGNVFGLFIILFAADLLVRYLITGHKSTAKITRFTEDVVRVEMENPFKHQQPGQYCFLMVPEISVFEYHPFSVASGPGEESLVFYVKASGDWTQKLQALSSAKKAADGGESAGRSEVALYLEGPYGHLSIDVFNGKVYPVAILMSGGVGITPMMGMLLHMIAQTQAGQLQDMKKVFFIWTVREQSMADNLYQEFFMPLLQNKLEPTAQGDDWRVKGHTGDGPVFEFNFHVTGKSRKIKVNVDAPRKVTAAADDSGLELQVIQRPAQEIAEAHTALWKIDRPNLPAIFADAVVVLNNNAQAGCGGASGRVSASVCGPKPLVEAMRDLSSQSYGCGACQGVRVDLHEELFNF